MICRSSLPAFRLAQIDQVLYEKVAMCVVGYMTKPRGMRKKILNLVLDGKTCQMILYAPSVVLEKMILK